MFHLCFCLTLVCVVVVSAAAALPEDATTWTTHQVSEWVDTLHSADAVAMKRGVAKYHITGNILMMIDTSDLEFELGVSSSLERKRILAAVDQLKDSFSENNVVLDFWELRALNRKMVDYSTPLLTTAPRWAITTFDDYPSYCTPLKTFGQGQHWVVAWVEWLLFPEWYIWSNKDSIMCGLPGFIPYVVWFNLATSVTSLVASIYKGEALTKAVFQFVKSKLQGELYMGVLAWLYSVFVWVWIPWFVCDFLFSLSVYVWPFFSLSTAVYDLVRSPPAAASDANHQRME